MLQNMGIYNFTQIMDIPGTRREASWFVHSGMDAMKGMEKITRMHANKILNYFTDRITNAEVGGTNSKIALIEKMA